MSPRDPIPIPTPSLRDKAWWESLSWERDGDCLLWPRYVNASSGYGVLSFRGSKVLAHRLAYVIHHGQIEPGRFVVQTCHNRRCCAPEHLEALTVTEAARRRLP